MKVEKFQVIFAKGNSIEVSSFDSQSALFLALVERVNSGLDLRVKSLYRWKDDGWIAEKFPSLHDGVLRD